MTLTISVVIPTYRRVLDLRRCLESLTTQQRLPDEVIVIIGPGDAAAAIVFDEVAAGRRGWISLSAAHPSVVESLNLGLAKTQGDIIVLTDDDAEAPPPWLRLIERHYLTKPEVGAVGGRDRQMVPERPEVACPQPAAHVGRFNWYGLLIGNHHCGASVSPLEVDVLKGVNFSFRRTAFPRLKIDPYLVSYGAEVGWEIDISLSIRRTGWKLIYDNDVYVLHHVSQRLPGDDRTDLASPSALRRAQNTSYLTAVYQPAFQVLAVLARFLIAGPRGQPGLVWGLIGLCTLKPHILEAAWKLAGAHLRGAYHGRMERNRRRHHTKSSSGAASALL